MDTPKDTLKKMTAWDIAPALTDAELDELLVKASLADAGNIAPLGAGWSPTYDLNAAAAAGWLIKAGRASGLADHAVFGHCTAMARSYMAKRNITVNIN